MREWFILYLNSDLEEWAKQFEILESGIKFATGFKESNFSLIPEAILHIARGKDDSGSLQPSVYT